MIKRELDFWGIEEEMIEPCCWNTYTAFRDAQKTLAELDEDIEGEEKPVSSRDEDGCPTRAAHLIQVGGRGSQVVGHPHFAKGSRRFHFYPADTKAFERLMKFFSFFGFFRLV